jgi:predicted nucleic acid-binding protein
VIVVSDSSPIIGLAGVGQVELLRLLFGEVVIPPAVREELLSGPRGAAALEASPWIRVEPIHDQQMAAELYAELDRGEAEAIVLAVELGAELLLIDERRGRAAAERRGLSAMGIVGVLLEAKSAGIIASVRPMLDGSSSEPASTFIRRSTSERSSRPARILERPPNGEGKVLRYERGQEMRFSVAFPVQS